MEFNYVKAWHDLAVPAYNALPDMARLVYAEFAVKHAKGVRQDGNCDYVGFTEWSRDVVGAFSLSELCRMSRAIYFVGHWMPSLHDGNFIGKAVIDPLGVGAYHKFSGLCDQQIRRRVWAKFYPEEQSSYRSEYGQLIPSHSVRGIGIHEGMLREQFSSKDYWLWNESAFADEEGMMLRGERPSGTSYSEIERFLQRCEKGEFAQADAKPWLDLSRFYGERRDPFRMRRLHARHADEIFTKRTARLEAIERRYWEARDIMTIDVPCVHAA